MGDATEQLPNDVRDELALREDALARVRKMLVQHLKVAIPEDHIDLDAPLFGTGIGLDSIDGIELVVAVEREFALHIPHGAVGPWPFRTVHALVDFVVHPPSSVARVPPMVSTPEPEPAR